MPIKLNLESISVIDPYDTEKIKTILEINAHCNDKLSSCIIQDLARSSVTCVTQSVWLYGMYISRDYRIFEFLYIDQQGINMKIKLEYDNFLYTHAPSVTVSPL